ncbi:MAG TPA: monovalent cation:proton antiporter-2 (CPA2) family protein [Burkholderiales bacterium]|nr:monovalent cation:proton antiporter-2 (CPA2) family protein [Burkholderiales bacterium]
MGEGSLFEFIVLLGAAVVLVPLAKRFGFGMVLGYLGAGVAIGPWALGLVADVENIKRIAEFGVVFLLFVIGLELQPSRLWALRQPIFGYGSAQVLITAGLLAAAALVVGLPPTAAVIIGLALSLSSTAFALQLLAERKELTARHGRMAFSILLFQDLAAIPMIAIVPLLAAMPANGAGAAELIEVPALLKAVAVVAAVIVGGRILLQPFFRIVASTGIPELFTAAALLVVVGTSLLVQWAGLSMALGAFLAGVLLADSEYRHELEGDIAPFRGLLLGLFFISVGMSLDLGLIARQPWLVIALVLGLVALKGLVLWALAWLDGQGRRCAVNLALYISQGGEFAFVLLSLAAGARVVDKPLADLMIVVVTASMAMTPLLLSTRHWSRRRGPVVEPQYDPIDAAENRVIIAGFGRFGQIVARVLRSRRIAFTALESSFEQVEVVRRFGNKIYFGDASRLELLHAAKARQAAIFVLAIDDVETSIKTAQLVKRHFPHLKIYARARNRHHVYRLLDVGVERIVRETFYSGLELADSVLRALGVSKTEAVQTIERFKTYDEALILRQYPFHQDEERLIATSREAAEELERVLEQDSLAREARAES